eukprot:g7117.t1
MKQTSCHCAGLVACRFKIWVQGFLGRHWLGRTLVAAVPCPRQELLTSRKMMGEIRRGSGAEDGAAVYRGGRGSRIFVWKESAAISTGIKVADVRDGLQNGPFNWKGLVVQALPPEMKQEAEAVGQPSHRSTEAAPYAEALGCAVVKAAASKHWGVAKALLQELSWSSEPARQKALAKADATRKTALRMCVDGLARDSKQLLQAWSLHGVWKLLLWPWKGRAFRNALGKSFHLSDAWQTRCAVSPEVKTETSASSLRELETGPASGAKQPDWCAMSIYVVSLAESGRLEMTRARLEALRIRFRRVDGVDLTRPGAFAAAKAEDLVSLPPDVGQQGTFGCAAAHFRAMKEAEKSRKPLALVMEDDIYPHEELV